MKQLINRPEEANVKTIKLLQCVYLNMYIKTGTKIPVQIPVPIKNTCTFLTDRKNNEIRIVSN